MDALSFLYLQHAVELGTSAITHNAVHLGEAATIRSLAGFNIGI